MIGNGWKLLRMVENENVEIRQVGNAALPSDISDWNTKGFKIISKSVKEVYGDVIVAPGLMVGGSDSKHYAKAAKNSYRFNPFPLSSNELNGLHGIDEKIKKKDFLDGIRSYIKIIEYGASS